MNLLTQPYTYIVILLFSLAGIAYCDYKYRLVIYKDNKASLKTWLILMGLFLSWDIAGILLEIFYTNPAYTIGLDIFTKDLPIEELLFLSLLIYTSVFLYNIAERHGTRGA